MYDSSIDFLNGRYKKNLGKTKLYYYVLIIYYLFVYILNDQINFYIYQLT